MTKGKRFTQPGVLQNASTECTHPEDGIVKDEVVRVPARMKMPDWNPSQASCAGRACPRAWHPDNRGAAHSHMWASCINRRARGEGQEGRGSLHRGAAKGGVQGEDAGVNGCADQLRGGAGVALAVVNGGAGGALTLGASRVQAARVRRLCRVACRGCHLHVQATSELPVISTRVVPTELLYFRDSEV